MARIAAIAVLAMLIALAVPGEAAHCTSYSTSDAITLPGPNGTLYVVIDNDECQPACAVSAGVYPYEETNGLPGLQRSDARQDDTCHGAFLPDATVRTV